MGRSAGDAVGALGPELLLCLEAVRALANDRVHDAAEFLYVHLVNIAAADALREGLAADADILTGEHVAALLKACGDQLARDTPRVLPVLRLWRQTLGGMLPAPDLESEQRTALGALELRLSSLGAPTGVRYRCAWGCTWKGSLTA